MNRTPIFILAGGKGSRLAPLTCHRAKPAVPFAGRYRIIDFVLSNAVNSGYGQVYVLTQFMASSLIKHLSRNWHLQGIQQFIEVVPAQMRRGSHWYLGTADAMWQNGNLLNQTRSECVGIFSGDHVYKFAIDQMQRVHEDSGARLTIAAMPVPLEEATAFGVLQVDATGRITGFQEKPANPTPMPGDPSRALVSMGNYFFHTRTLLEYLEDDAERDDSDHDFGKNIIPKMLDDGLHLQVYDFGTNKIPGERNTTVPYWRDVGTLEAYFLANMEVRSSLPALNLYNRSWRIRTAQRDYPPSRMVRHSASHPVSSAIDSLIAEGSIVSSSTLDRVLVGYDCFIHAGCYLQESLMLSGCDIGEGARLRGVMMDKNCQIEAGAEIGFSERADLERFPFRTESGLVVLPKGTQVPRSGPIRFAHDMATLMERDPHTCDTMKAWKGRYTVADQSRHSHDSSGPRYR